MLRSLTPHSIRRIITKQEGQRKEKDVTTKWIGGSPQPDGYEKRPSSVVEGARWRVCESFSYVYVKRSYLTSSAPTVLPVAAASVLLPSPYIGCEADLVMQEALSVCPHLQNSQALSDL